MTPDEREDFEERAAIVEEGNPGMTRAEAERIALDLQRAQRTTPLLVGAGTQERQP